MIGALIGDIVGSRFEYKGNNIHSKEFEFFSKKCRFTDDTVISIAVCEALMNSRSDYGDLGGQAVISMQKLGRYYPRAGYGKMFRSWIFSDNPKPYYSFGNGAAMRISGCSYAAESLEQLKALSRSVTETTHNHPEGIKGAEAVSAAVFLARKGKSIKEIRDYIITHYYKIDFTLDSIRDTYSWSSRCQSSVPQAFEAFFESTGFEDAIRNAISIGGDSDTIASIAGSIAGAHYGVPEDIRKQALSFLDTRLRRILGEFEKRYLN